MWLCNATYSITSASLLLGDCRLKLYNFFGCLLSWCIKKIIRLTRINNELSISILLFHFQRLRNWASVWCGITFWRWILFPHSRQIDSGHCCLILVRVLGRCCSEWVKSSVALSLKGLTCLALSLSLYIYITLGFAVSLRDFQPTLLLRPLCALTFPTVNNGPAATD